MTLFRLSKGFFFSLAVGRGETQIEIPTCEEKGNHEEERLHDISLWLLVTDHRLVGKYHHQKAVFVLVAFVDLPHFLLLHLAVNLEYLLLLVEFLHRLLPLPFLLSRHPLTNDLILMVLPKDIS